VLGLAPALHLSRLNLVGAVKESGATQSSSQGHTRNLLVVSQMALAVVLLAGAGLLIQSLSRLLSVDPGFASDHILSFRAELPDNYPPQQQQDYYQQLLTRLRALPAVRAASAVYGLPLSGMPLNVSYGIEGRHIPESDEPSAAFNVAEPGYFHTLNIALLRGRDFDHHDDISSPPVVIVNEAFARETFGNDDPLGKRIKPGVGNGYKQPPMRTIIAVIRNTQSDSLGSPAAPELFIPLAQCPRIGAMTFVLRTQMDPLATVAAAQAQASSIDKTVPLFRVKTLDQYLAASVAQPRFNVLLLCTFASLALVIAGIGLYGAISYSVTQRTHEIGIRLALGAQPKEILRIVVTQGAALSLLGIGIGLLAALALTRLIASLLFNVRPRDPLTFTAVAVLLILVALLASILPARRAMRVDPLVALRYE
jgi:putative ABC transport system permease protein